MRPVWPSARAGVVLRVTIVAARRQASSAAAAAAAIPSDLSGAEVDSIVIGGGIIGASCGWQLARLGRRVLVLEQNTLTSGTTWHGKSNPHARILIVPFRSCNEGCRYVGS